VVGFSHQQFLPASLLGKVFRIEWFSKVPSLQLQRVVWWHVKINSRFIGTGNLPHQKIYRLPQFGNVPLIIEQLLFKIFWELLAYPTPQRQPHSAHEPYGPSFTGFKTTSTNVQRCGLLYRLPAK
jgi:hypothetical protein